MTQETIEAVIAACPDNDWRLIFAFARYAGLRIPSEIENLRWSDVNWERQRITIHVPKKAHLPGQETRVLPIFPELRPYLDRAFAEAADRAELVVPRARGARNLRRYAEQIIKKAGVQQWPKLFQNCRASRETELMQSHPAHVVLAWIGHTAAVAQAHYLTVTDGDFARATGGGEASKRAPENPAQIPAHSVPVTGRQEPLALHESRKKSLNVRENREIQYPRQGSNKSGFTREKPGKPRPTGTNSGTSAEGTETDDLLMLWVTLKPAQRQVLLAMARELGRARG